MFFVGPGQPISVKKAQELCSGHHERLDIQVNISLSLSLSLSLSESLSLSLTLFLLPLAALLVIFYFLQK